MKVLIIHLHGDFMVSVVPPQLLSQELLMQGSSNCFQFLGHFVRCFYVAEMS